MRYVNHFEIKLQQSSVTIHYDFFIYTGLRFMTKLTASPSKTVPDAHDQNHDASSLTPERLRRDQSVKLAAQASNTAAAIGAIAFFGDVLSRFRTYADDAAKKTATMAKYLPKPGKLIMRNLTRLPSTTPLYGVVGVLSAVSYLLERDNTKETFTTLDHVRNVATAASIPTGAVAMASVALKFTPGWRMFSEATAIGAYSGIRLPNSMEKQELEIKKEKETPGKHDRDLSRMNDRAIWGSLGTAYVIDWVRKFGVASSKFRIPQELVTVSFSAASVATAASTAYSANAKMKEDEFAKDFQKYPVLRTAQYTSAAAGAAIALPLVPMALHHRLTKGKCIKENLPLNLAEITTMQQSALSRAAAWAVYLSDKVAALPKQAESSDISSDSGQKTKESATEQRSLTSAKPAESSNQAEKFTARIINERKERDLAYQQHRLSV